MDNGFMQNDIDEILAAKLNCSQDFADVLAQLNAESEGEVEMNLSSEDYSSSQIEWNLNDCIQNGIVNKLQDESNEIIIDYQPQRGAQPLSTGIPRFLNNTLFAEEIKQNQKSNRKVIVFVLFKELTSEKLLCG